MSSPKGKILILDEDLQSRGETRVLLDAAGYDACICETASQCLSLIKNYQPDCLLLNLRVPAELEGKPFLPYVREQFPDLAIVAYTNTTEFSKHDLIKANVCFIVQKPFSLNLFLNTIERALNEQSPQLKRSA